MRLRLGGRQFDEHDFTLMAVVNRTPDSFYDRGCTYTLDAALAAADRALAEGADVIDVGGVKAGPGDDVDVDEEKRRVTGLLAALRTRHPDALLSVDTWRSDVAEAAVAAGADLINDTWGGVDPRVAEVAAATDAGLVCAHTGGLPPRTRPHRVAYADPMADVVQRTAELADRAVGLGVRPDGILLDPAHDFGKNTRHSLEVTRRLNELVDTGWPVLVAVSHKDFIGEALDVPLDQRGEGTLATLAVAAWLGARVFRVHDVRAARRALDMVAAITGRRPPAVSRRGLV